jgi:hypothetical protein
MAARGERSERPVAGTDIAAQPDEAGRQPPGWSGNARSASPCFGPVCSRSSRYTPSAGLASQPRLASGSFARDHEPGWFSQDSGG